MRSDVPCTETLETIGWFWSSMAGYEDLCDHPDAVSFHANIALSWFAWRGMTRGLRDASRGHGAMWVHWVVVPHGRGAADYNLNDGLHPLQGHILAPECSHPEMRRGPSPGGLSGTIGNGFHSGPSAIQLLASAPQQVLAVSENFESCP